MSSPDVETLQAAYDEARALIEEGDADGLWDVLEERPELALTVEEETGWCLLHRAAAAGDDDVLRALLEAGAPPDLAAEGSAAALHWAASLGHTELCRVLLESGASPAREDGLGEGGTPLVTALFYGHADTAAVLAEAAVVPENLRVAAGLGDLAAIDRFLAPGGVLRPGAGAARAWYRPHDEFPHRPTTGEDAEILAEALCYACANRRTEAALCLIVRGADPNLKPHYATPLHHAVATGSNDLVDLLLDSGADPTLHDDAYGSDAAGWAEWMGHDELAGRLRRAAARRSLEAAVELGDPALVEGHLEGLDLEATEAAGRGNTLLLEATLRGHGAVADLLRRRGARFDLPTAARLGLEDEVRQALEDGADPDATSPIEVNVCGEGATTRPQSALLGAAVHRHEKICRLLLDAGARLDPFSAAALGRTGEVLAALDGEVEVDAVDAFGRSLLHRAIQGDRLDTVRALLERGADVRQSADGFSHGPRALHVAAAAGAGRELLAALLEAGAELEESSNLGTPLECAERAGREAAAKALRELGAHTS